MATTTIVSGIKVEGKITGHTDVKVDGVVIGDIVLKSSIYVSNEGQTEATINAENVFIAGTHTGNVTAKELVQISATAVVKGEIRAPYISIEKGAKFSGLIETTDASEAPQESTSTKSFDSLVKEKDEKADTKEESAEKSDTPPEKQEQPEVKEEKVEEAEEKVEELESPEEDAKKKESELAKKLAA